MEDAGLFWEIMAGQGTWGALLFAVVGLLWKFAKPYLDQWVAEKRLQTLYNFAQTSVQSTKQTLTDGLRAASADGKLTKDEAKQSFDDAKGTFIALCKTQGIDVVKEYGSEFVTWLIEKFVGDSKEAELLKAVALPLSGRTVQTAQETQQPPLPDLQPLQPFAQSRGVPAVTGADFGSETKRRD